jgi:uncharacterized OsmC-like protein
MTTDIKRLNSVNAEAVGSLVEAIRDEPARAHTTWRATVQWHEGFRSSASIRDFAPIHSDEPEALGGTDTAPNPVEQLLGALGNCLAVGYAAGATGIGVALHDLRIELEGDIDLHSFLGLDDGHAGYGDVRVTVHLESDASREVLEQLHRQVVGTSPVGHSVNRAIPLAIDLA